MKREVVIIDSLGNIVIPLTAAKDKVKSETKQVKHIPIPSGFIADEAALVLLDLLKKFTKLQGGIKK